MHLTTNLCSGSVRTTAKIGNLYAPDVAGAFAGALAGSGDLGGALDATVFHAAAA